MTRQNFVVPAAMVGILAVIIIFSPEVAKDNTDPHDGRSGMGLHTDCLTGLQYLSGDRGGLAPRLGVDGRQIIDRSGCEE